MQNLTATYRKVLVATDFSTHADAALTQAIWLAKQGGAEVTLAHVLPHPRRFDQYEFSTMGLEIEPRPDEQKAFEEEKQRTLTRLEELLVGFGAKNLGFTTEVYVGDPFLEIIHAVKKHGYELVITGSRGLAAWEQFIVGSTTHRLIRKCPSSVWVVHEEDIAHPKAVLAATDFSDLSRRAILEARRIANLAGGQLHVVHVIDTLDVPENVVASTPAGMSVRERVNQQAKERLDDFLSSMDIGPSTVHRYLSWGTPWKEIVLLSKHLHARLIAMGTVGRSGIRGMLLGNTAERVMNTCHCSMLTVKSPEFVSPVLGP